MRRGSTQGVGGAAVWAGAIAWLMAIGTEADRGRLIGLAMAAGGIGACAGPAVGALAQAVGTEPTFLGLAGAILALAAAGVAVARHGPGHDAPRSPAGIRAALRFAGTRRALLVVAMPSIGYGVAGVLVPLRLHALGASAATIAGAYVVASLFEALVQPGRRRLLRSARRQGRAAGDAVRRQRLRGGVRRSQPPLARAARGARRELSRDRRGVGPGARRADRGRRAHRRRGRARARPVQPLLGREPDALGGRRRRARARLRGGAVRRPRLRVCRRGAGRAAAGART